MYKKIKPNFFTLRLMQFSDLWTNLLISKQFMTLKVKDL